jgi:hypothetical protein
MLITKTKPSKQIVKKYYSASFDRKLEDQIFNSYYRFENATFKYDYPIKGCRRESCGDYCRDHIKTRGIVFKFS